MSFSTPRVNTPALKLQVVVTESALRVSVRGQVDVSNIDALRAALAATDVEVANAVTLDLRKLTFCDTAGCWALLMFEREARLSGHPTNILGATHTVERVLSLLADGDLLTFT